MSSPETRTEVAPVCISPQCLFLQETFGRGYCHQHMDALVPKTASEETMLPDATTTSGWKSSRSRRATAHFIDVKSIMKAPSLEASPVLHSESISPTLDDRGQRAESVAASLATLIQSQEAGCSVLGCVTPRVVDNEGVEESYCPTHAALFKDKSSMDLARASVYCNKGVETAGKARVKKTDLNIDRVIGREGKMMFNALLQAAKKDIGMSKAWAFKAALFKIIVTGKTLVSNGTVEKAVLQSFVEPLNQLGTLLLQLLHARKAFPKAAESNIKIVVFCTQLTTIVNGFISKILVGRLDEKDILKGRACLSYFGSISFVTAFLNDSEFRASKKLMKKHARLILKTKLKPQCAKPKCPTSRVLPQAGFDGSRFCARHHLARMTNLYDPPNFVHFLNGDTSDFLSFHEYFEKANLDIGPIGPIPEIKEVVEKRGEDEVKGVDEGGGANDSGEAVPDIGTAPPAVPAVEGESVGITESKPGEKGRDGEDGAEQHTATDTDTQTTPAGGKEIQTAEEAVTTPQAEPGTEATEAVVQDSAAVASGGQAETQETQETMRITVELQKTTETETDAGGEGGPTTEGETAKGATDDEVVEKPPLLVTQSYVVVPEKDDDDDDNFEIEVVEAPVETEEEREARWKLEREEALRRAAAERKLDSGLNYGKGKNLDIIRFCQTVEAYRNAPKVKERKKLGEIILQKYLREGSERQLHWLMTKHKKILQPVYAKFEVGLGAVSSTIFTGAHEVARNTVLEQFNKFTSSSEYEARLNRFALPAAVVKRLANSVREENAEDDEFDSNRRVTFAAEDSLVQIIAFSAFYSVALDGPEAAAEGGRNIIEDSIGDRADKIVSS